jgi:hypothetical protein
MIAAACAAPIVLIAGHVCYVARCVDRQQIPRDLLMSVARAAGASLVDLEDTLRRGHEISGVHIDLRQGGPIGSRSALDEAEEFIEVLTSRLGGRSSRRLRWVRGPTVVGDLTRFRGMVLSDVVLSPAGTGRLSPLDRHELAHGVLRRLEAPGAAPPMLIWEGWAESQSADLERHARALLLAREAGATIKIKEFFRPRWRHSIRRDVYTYGGVFVDLLLRRNGPREFLTLYRRVAADPSRASAAVELALGRDIDQIDGLFWKHVEELAGDA